MRQHWSLQLDAERLLPSLWTPTGTGTTLPAFTQFRVGRAITMWMNSGLLLAPCGPLGRRQGAPRPAPSVPVLPTRDEIGNGPDPPCRRPPPPLRRPARRPARPADAARGFRLLAGFGTTVSFRPTIPTAPGRPVWAIVTRLGPRCPRTSPRCPVAPQPLGRAFGRQVPYPSANTVNRPVPACREHRDRPARGSGQRGSEALSVCRDEIGTCPSLPRSAIGFDRSRRRRHRID